MLSLAMVKLEGSPRIEVKGKERVDHAGGLGRLHGGAMTILTANAFGS